MRPVPLAALAALVVAAGPAAAQADGAAGAPEEYTCLFPYEHDEVRELLHSVECRGGSEAWRLVWYYPPVAYQAWCFLTHDCPCPHCPPAPAAVRA